MITLKRYRNKHALKIVVIVFLLIVATYAVSFARTSFGLGQVRWTGAVSSDWTDVNNWENAIAPSADSDVLIDGGAYQPTLDLTSGTLTIGSLTIGGSADSILTVAYGAPVTNELHVSRDLTIADKGTLTHAQNYNAETHRLAITVDGNATIEAGGKIDVTGKGYSNGGGPGNTGLSTAAAYGGDSDGGTAYGSIIDPTNIGSGGRGGYGGGGGAGSTPYFPANGGNGIYGGAKNGACTDEGPGGNGSYSSSNLGGTAGVGGVSCYFGRIDGGAGGQGGSGGAGGGSITLNISGSLTNNGSITANGGLGNDGSDGNPGGGGSYGGGGGAGGQGGSGGAGGGIHITAGTTPTIGTVSADGGAGGQGGNGGAGGIGKGMSNSTTGRSGTAGVIGSGGAGGRISIESNDNVDQQYISADSGSGLETGGAGTIYLKSTNYASGQIFVLSDSQVDYSTPSQDWPDGVSLNIGTGAIFETSQAVDTPKSLNSLVIESGGVLRLKNSGGSGAINMSFSGGVNLKTGSLVDAAGDGFAAGQGPGAGIIAEASGKGGSGAGHGGIGGNTPTQLGGVAYDILENPTQPGSGGGNGSSGAGGGDGGGIIKLTSTTEIIANGDIKASGSSAILTGSTNMGGGGSGGSINLSAPVVGGLGSLNAIGGNGTAGAGGGGAGGRVAITRSGNITITSISPQAGINGGNTITISGTNFIPNSEVTFSTEDAVGNIYSADGVVSFVDSTTLSVVVPSAPFPGTTTVTVSDESLSTMATVSGGTGYSTGGDGTIYVNSTNSTYSTADFSYHIEPTISSVAPNTAQYTGGDVITVTGDNFTDSMRVKLLGKYVTTVTSIDNHTLSFIAPPADITTDTPIDVVVEDKFGQQAVSPDSLTYVMIPMNISGVSPSVGASMGDQIVTISGENFSPGIKDISSVSVGANNTCGIYNGSAYCWGYNAQGQLGNGSTTSSTTPVAVSITGVLAGKTIKSIDTGVNHTCVIASDNLVYCWGYNSNGQLGNGSVAQSTVPVAVNTAGVLAGKTIKSITAGDNHTCAIASDDLAYCWGYNANGQLGNNSTTQSTVPVAVNTAGVLAGKTIKSLSAGSNHTCAIASDDLAYCWGYNAQGQLGNGSTTQSNVPSAVNTAGVLAGKTIKSITTGQYFTCTIASDDLAYCWGYNYYGQLGNGSTTQSNVPSAVNTAGVLAGKTIKSITTGQLFTCATASDDQVYCWGYNANGQLGNGSTTQSNVPSAVDKTGMNNEDVLSVYAGGSNSCILSINKRLYCSGYNANGQLGNGSTTQSTTPTAVTPVIIRPLQVTFGGVLSSSVQYISTTEIKATTPAHTAGLADITVTRYDDNTATLASSYEYMAVPHIDTVSPNSGLISGGDTITITGSEFTPGMRVWLGDAEVPSVTTVDGTTLTFTLPARTNAQTLDVTLQDTYGQRDILAAGFTYKFAPMSITSISPNQGPSAGGQAVTILGTNFSPGIREISDISTGIYHSCGIYSGNAYCWGYNNQGQLGNGSNTLSITPVAVNTAGVLAGKTIKSISVGDNHTCAIASDNLVYCWGYNANGQLGNGSTTQSTVPVAVNTTGVLAGKTIKSIAAGVNHTCVIASDDHAYCWGYNNYGGLGNSSTIQSTVPVAVNTAGVLAGKTVKSISVGTNYTCAVASDDMAYCWGYNGSGQLGNGSTSQSTIPVAVNIAGVLAGKTIKSISAGTIHTCAIASDNLVYCWGYNGNGGLGNGSTTQSTTPVAVDTSGVLAGKTIKSISSGQYFTCAVASDDQSYCWGSNGNGQLGNGSTTQSTTPVAVDTSGVLAGKTIKSISSGVYHICAIASDNYVYCWGYNVYGALGDGTTTQSTIPVAVTQIPIRPLQVTIDGNDAQNIEYISSTELHAVTPAHLAGLTDVSVTRYDDNTVASTDGYEYLTQPHLDTVSPASGPVSGGDTITLSGSGFRPGLKVTIGNMVVTSVNVIDDTTATFVTPSNNEAQAVDVSLEDEYGQKSNVLTGGYRYLLLVSPQISSITPNKGPTSGNNIVDIDGSGFVAKTIQSISSGLYHTCTIASDDLAYCWGYNPYGALGDGTTTQSPTPVAVDTSGVLAGKTIKSISSGQYSTCAVASDDLAYCWGYNNNGQLGIGTTTQSPTPVAVDTSGVLAGKTIKSISSGSNHACAIASDDLAYCWGYNGYGGLGDGSTTQSTVPVAVNTSGALAGKTIKSISVGQHSTCAIASDDLAYCWGYNSNGQLGTGNTTAQHLPVAVDASGALAGKTIKSISSGTGYTCAVASDNLAYCWGNNGNGQLGNGSTTQSTTPVAVTASGALADKTIKSVSTSSNHTCAIASDDQAYCWGYNGYGKLGDGSVTQSTTPVAVDTSGVLASKTIRFVSLGNSHTCAIASDDQAYCWGSNAQDQLGNESAPSSSDTPLAVEPIVPLPIVTFDNIVSSGVSYVSSTKLQAIVPSHTSGAVDVSVENYDTQTYSASGAYEYLSPPVAASVSPNTGNIAGGDTVTLNGSGFQGNLTVTMAGVTVSNVNVLSDTSISFTTPARPQPGSVDITVTDGYGQSTTLVNGFTYMLSDPSITSISPKSGPSGGGTDITIKGSGFVTKTSGGTWYRVLVDGVLATNIAYVDSETLTATTPAHSVGVVDVSIESDYTNSVSSQGAFTYLPQKFAFTNAPLNIATDQTGKLTIQAQNADSTPAITPVDVIVDLTTTSSNGAFSQNLYEDISTRWSYTSVTIPAGQSSVDIWYKDTVSGNPTITGAVRDSEMTFAQNATIDSPYRLSVSGITNPTKVGQPSSVTVRVVDKQGNQRTDFTGTIAFSSTDTAASLPADYVFKTSDYGIKTFTNGVNMGSSGTFCVKATATTDSVITGSQCNITVEAPNAGTISKLAFISPEQHVVSGGYSNAITIQTQDATGEFIPVSNDTPIYIYSTSNTGEFSADGSTWSNGQPFVATIPKNTSTTNIYYRDSVAQKSTLSARDLQTDTGDNNGGDFAYENATQYITTGVSPPTQMRISGDTALVSGTKGTVTVELLDDFGNIVNAPNDITVRVDSSTTTGRFYNPATSSTAYSGPFEFIIPSGATGVTIGFSDTTLSTSTDYTKLTFVDGRPSTEVIRLADTTSDMQIVQAMPSIVSLSANPKTITVDQSTAVTISLLDSNNNQAYAVGDTPISLQGSNGGEFSLSASPFTPISSISFTQGESSKIVYYRNTVSGSSTLTGSSAGLTSQTDTVTVTSGAISSFAIAPNSQDVELNTSSNAYIITAYDVYGNIAFANSALPVYLYSDNTTTEFSADGSNNWSATSVSIPNGGSTTEFYASDQNFYAQAINLTASDMTPLDTTDTGIANASATLNIVRQQVKNIRITSSEQTIKAGDVSSKITVELLRGDNTPAIQDGSSDLSISVPSGKLVSTQDANAPSISSITISNGGYTAEFYYTGETSGVFPISLSMDSVTSSQPITVSSDDAVSMNFATVPQSIAPDSPSDPIRINFYDQYGNIAPLSANSTFDLASTCGTGSISLSNSLWVNTNSTAAIAGDTGFSFYYKDPSPGDCTLTVTGGSFGSETQTIHINSYAVDSIRITTTERVINAGEVTKIIGVELYESDGTPAIQDGTSRLDLSVAQGNFVATADSSAPSISNIVIAKGESTASFYYTSTRAGTFTMTVQLSTNSVTDTQNVTVNPLSASKLSIVTPEQTIPAGSPSQDIRANILDQYGNITQLAADTEFTLSSSCDTGVFSVDNLTWENTTTITGQAGISDLTFFYKDTVARNCMLTVSAPGLTESSQNILVTNSTNPARIVLSVPSGNIVKGTPYVRVAIILYDEYGNITPAPANTTIYLSSPSANLSLPATTTVQKDYVSTYIYVSSNESGTYTISARDQLDMQDAQASLQDNESQITFVDGPAQKLSITGPSTAMPGEEKTFQVGLLNHYNLPITATQDTTVSLSTTGTGNITNTSGDIISSITIPAGQPTADINYSQTLSGNIALIATENSLDSGAHWISIVSKDSLYEIRFANAPHTGSNSLIVDRTGYFQVGLYDQYGNTTTNPTDITLYPSADFAGNMPASEFTIPAGTSMGSFLFTPSEAGTFTMNVSDSNGVDSGTYGTISQDVEVKYQTPPVDPIDFKFSIDSLKLVRGGISNAITVTLVDSTGKTITDSKGRTIQLSGPGGFALSRNNMFTNTLNLYIPAGKSTASFYYRNDTAEPGQYTIQGTSNGTDLSISHLLDVTIEAGEAVSLAYITPSRTVKAGDPSAVLTVERQNKYGKPVPVPEDTILHLSSQSSSGRFASDKITWDVDTITMKKGESTASFYYSDTTEGDPQLTVADTLPLSPDAFLKNAIQSIHIDPPSPTPRTLDNFLVTNISDPQNAGTSSSVIVIARDADGFIVDTFDGIVTFSSDDPQAILPDSYKFAQYSDRGVHVFTNGVAFKTTGEKSVTVTSGGITGTQTGITVLDANESAVKSLTITQPVSPPTIAPNYTSPSISIELRDDSDRPTVASFGGFPIHLTSSSPTGEFATNPAGPWAHELTTIVPMGLSFANVYYHDSSLGTPTITASDWLGGTDSNDISNTSLDINVRNIRLESTKTIESRNVFGKLQKSAYLFSNNSQGTIDGQFNAHYDAKNIIDNSAIDVLWRSEWRHGVTLLESETKPKNNSLTQLITAIETQTGSPNFYAVAQATESSFSNSFSVVSLQHSVPVSPWISSIDSVNNLDPNAPIDLTANFTKYGSKSSPDISILYLLSGDANDTTSPLSIFPQQNPGYSTTMSINAGILAPNSNYLFMVETYDIDGNITSQAMSKISTGGDQTVVEPTPDEGGISVIPPTSSSLTPDTKPGKKPTKGDTNNNPLTPQPNDNTNDSTTDDKSDSPHRGKLTTALVLSTLGTSSSIIILLIREGYKELARIRNIYRFFRSKRRLADNRTKFIAKVIDSLDSPRQELLTLASSNLALNIPANHLSSLIDNIDGSTLSRTAPSDLEESYRNPMLKSLRSPFFWLPVILSVALSIAANSLMQSAGKGLVSSTSLYFSVISVALILMAFFVARTIQINRESAKLEKIAKLHSGQLFAAQNNLLMSIQSDIAAEVARLNQLNTDHNLDDIIESLGTATSNLAISIRLAENRKITKFSPRNLLDKINKKYHGSVGNKHLAIAEPSGRDVLINQDEGLLSVAVTTLINTVAESSNPGENISVITKNEGNAVTMSITSSSFNQDLHRKSANDTLNLSLSRLIAGKLGGSLKSSASSSGEYSISLSLPISSPSIAL